MLMRAITTRQSGWMGLGLLLVSVFVLSGNAFATSTEDSSFDNLDIVDSSLVGKVGVLRVGSEVGENKLLSVFAGLKNKTGHRIELEVQTIYKDEFNNALNSGSWIPFTLVAHEEKEYHSASISTQAVDFLIRIRRAPTASTTP
jgi:hypothetical protein